MIKILLPALLVEAINKPLLSSQNNFFTNHSFYCKTTFTIGLLPSVTNFLSLKLPGIFSPTEYKIMI